MIFKEKYINPLNSTESWVFIIILSFFREPIAALFGISSLVDYLIFIIPVFFLYKAYSTKKLNSHINPLLNLFISTMILSGLYIIFLKIYSPETESLFIVNFIQDVFLYQLFPFITFIAIIDLEKNLFTIFNKVTIIFIWLASFYIIIQYSLIAEYNILTTKEVNTWLAGNLTQPDHIPGFIGSIANSSLILTAFSNYYLTKKLISDNEFKLNKNLFAYITILISIYAVSISYSITNLFLYLTITLFVFFVWGLKNKQLLYSSILSVPILLIFSSSSAIGKLSRYLGHTLHSSGKTYLEVTKDLFLPSLADCDIKLHIAEKSISFCSNHELHIFSETTELGLIPDLPRLLIIFLPIILFFYILKDKKIKYYPLVVFAIIIIFGSIHYPTVTTWPIIFIYQIIIALLLNTYRKSNLQKEQQQIYLFN